MSRLGYSEDALVEQPAIALFGELDWETANCFHEFEQLGGSPLGRETAAEVVLISRLRPFLEKLNSGLPEEAITLAIEELTRDRSALSPAQANREVYKLIKDGVKVKCGAGKKSRDDETRTVRVIDWDNPQGNDFLLCSQLWISGEMYKRRADLVGFVNGLPLVFIELKASHKRLEDAYNKNLRDYRDTIPHIFWHNAFIILSNGSQSLIGSTTAEWEHFGEWKKINSEGEQGIISLETMIRGTCEQSRLLDIAENFTFFTEEFGPLVKILAANHQFLGVKSAVKAVRQIEGNQGRLGVFWHTQGSGKSYSMIMFSQIILRKLPGNWTFLIITDRDDLDDQIYKKFAQAGVVTEKEARATSGQHLQQLLREDHRYIFTLIQKFRTEKGQTYPKLSDRSDVIVITDEAHRSQYDIFAMNMRNALPNAAFIAFTGTPLIVGEEKTREVFGDYVSTYDFKQSVDDKNTVPLHYENRIPELQLTNENLNEDMERLLEDAELDDEQEKKLEREFAREYHLITRDDRLEKIADDIVQHFMTRGYVGKAMVICIDKATAVRMYDKVKRHWREYLESVREELDEARGPQREEWARKLTFMEETDMAVVVSQSQNEVDEFRKKGLDIGSHRKRMLKQDLDEKFKDPRDPFRIVFVCAMWMTGFDVPCCSTMYLDKPMRNHTLMQTIARANRVFPQKNNGLIVDYVGVFRNLQKALAIYGTGSGGGVQEGETPVSEKAALIDHLKETIEEAVAFCGELGIDFSQLTELRGFERVRFLDEAVEAILVNEATKTRYLSLAESVDKLFKAALPSRTVNEFYSTRTALVIIAEIIRSLMQEADISEVMARVELLLDSSIATEAYVIREPKGGKYKDRYVDLSKIDFDALKKHFEESRKRTEAEKLKRLLQSKLEQMIQQNKTRMDYLKRLQRMIDEYNAGSINVEIFFQRLVDFTRDLRQEEQRTIAEDLTEEELAIFDLLTKPDPKLTKKEELQVKKVGRELLQTLKNEKLVLDWRKRQQSRAAVRLRIEETLDGLPPVYARDVYEHKCEAVYQHVYDSYFGPGQSIYMTAA